MRKITLAALFVCAAFFSFAQPCADIFVSEIVFGEIPSLKGQAQQNYSIELFNPTDNAINLTNYKLDLYTETNQKTAFDITGTIAAKGTHVVSYTNSSTPITSVSDELYSNLILDNFVLLELTDGTNTLDVIGKAGVSTDISEIDIEALLNDPSYINNLEINLKSLKNLTVRRRGTIQEGRTAFLPNEIMKNWQIYPHFFTENLGDHDNVCRADAFGIQWVDNTGNGVALLEDEERILADSYYPLEGRIELVGGTSTEDITMTAPYIQNIGPVGFDEATLNQDFEVADPFDNEFDVFAFDGSDILVPLCVVFDETEVENTEVASFRLEYGFTGGSDVFIGFPEVFWVSILDDDASATTNLNVQNQVLLYPAVSASTVTLSTDIEDMKFKSVFFYSLEGKFEKSLEINSFGQTTIDISDAPRGHHIMMVFTSKGTIAKRFIKI